MAEISNEQMITDLWVYSDDWNEFEKDFIPNVKTFSDRLSPKQQSILSKTHKKYMKKGKAPDKPNLKIIDAIQEGADFFIIADGKKLGGPLTATTIGPVAAWVDENMYALSQH